MITRKTIAGAAVVAALAAVFVLPAALAQDPDDAGTQRGDHPRSERRAAHQAQLAAALAEELGLETDTVAAALEKVHADMDEQRRAERRARLEERLDAAVEAGTLTREQADAILAADDAGVLRAAGGRDGYRPWGRGGRSGDHGEWRERGSWSNHSSTARP